MRKTREDLSLADGVLKGDVLSAARLISCIENEDTEAFAELDKIYNRTGKSSIIGVTGPPGAGKSTLISSLIAELRKRNLTIGVVAVDPSSAFTGGAILGDRVRMQRHNTDKDVFIRSLATRGWIGGLAKAALGAVHVMDAMGKDIVLVETVGSGQIEIDITRAADTTVIVLTPGVGDEMQMMKAGILEAADVFVINKADKEGAEVLKSDLEMTLMMRDSAWKPQVILSQAVFDRGIDSLADEIMRHRKYLIESGELAKRKRARARFELMETVESYLKSRIVEIDRGGYLEKLVDDLTEGKTSPNMAAAELTNRLAKSLGKLKD